MEAKKRKELLFKKSRPTARRFEVMDGDKYSKDVGILWAAYKAGSFKLPEGLSQEEFMSEIEKTMMGFQNVWVIDDDTKVYSNGRGPVGIVGSNAVGMVVEPRFMFFKWATCRNILKSTVAYLNMIKASLRTGIVLVRADKERKAMADHLRKRYDLLFFLGKSAENEYLYSARGRGSVS